MVRDVPRRAAQTSASMLYRREAFTAIKDRQLTRLSSLSNGGDQNAHGEMNTKKSLR
jgi:hypothetical protein